MPSCDRPPQPACPPPLGAGRGRPADLHVERHHAASFSTSRNDGQLKTRALFALRVPPQGTLRRHHHSLRKLRSRTPGPRLSPAVGPWSTSQKPGTGGLPRQTGRSRAPSSVVAQYQLGSDTICHPKLLALPGQAEGLLGVLKVLKQSPAILFKVQISQAHLGCVHEAAP